MAGYCSIILVTICLLHCQILATQRKKSEEIVRKDWASASNSVKGLSREVVALVFKTSNGRNLLLVNNYKLSSYLSKLRDATTRSLHFGAEPHQKSWQHLAHRHLYEKKKTSGKVIDNGKRNMMKQSPIGKSTLGDGDERVKRSVSKKKRSEGLEENKILKKKNDSDIHSLSEAELSAKNRIPMLTSRNDNWSGNRTPHEKTASNAESESGSDSSASSPLVYILPAILGFLIISLLVTLLMYRNLRSKARRASPENEAQLPSFRELYHRKAESHKASKNPAEPVELVSKFQKLFSLDPQNLVHRLGTLRQR